MECSSATLWADHRLAVGQNSPLTPKSRRPHLFLLISLTSLPIYLLAVAPVSIWAAPLFSISLFFGMQISAVLIREVAGTRPCCQGQKELGYAWWASCMVYRGIVSME